MTHVFIMKMAPEIMTTSRKNYIYIVCGFLFIISIIYFKLIYVRIPKDLYTNKNSFLFMSYLITMCIFLFLLIKNVSHIMQKYKFIGRNANNYIFIKKILLTLTMLFYKSLRSIEQFINSYITTIDFKLCFELMHYATTKITYLNIQKATWIFDYIPRLMLLSCFSYDVFFLHKFYYFFKVIPITILPLLYR